MARQRKVMRFEESPRKELDQTAKGQISDSRARQRFRRSGIYVRNAGATGSNPVTSTTENSSFSLLTCP